MKKSIVLTVYNNLAKDWLCLLVNFCAGLAKVAIKKFGLRKNPASLYNNTKY